MDDVSVVILPDGSHGDGVRHMLGTWARAGIISPMLVVRKGGVIESPPEPIRVSATLIGAAGDQDVDLFSFLGRYRLTIVRIVMAQLVPTPDDGDVELSKLGRALAKTVKSALPLDPAGHPITRLHRTALVIPATGVQGVDQGVLRPSWEANVLISPEDRPDVDRPSVFVRASENYVGHATAAVGAAAGVICGVPGGGLDEITTDSSTSPDDVVVARVSIRTVIGDDVVDVLARKAFDPGVLGSAGPASVMDSGHLNTEPGFLIDRSVEAILGSPRWAPSPEPQEQAPEITRDRVGRSIGAAARFNLRTTLAVGAWTVSRSRDRLDAAATETLVGREVGSLVTVGPRVVDNIEHATAEMVDSQRREMDARVAYEASRGSPPAPTTWSELRQFTLALCDGSPVSLIEEPRQLGKRELLSPGDVVPHPAVFTVDDDRVLYPTDIDAMARYHDELAERMQEMRSEVASLEQSLDMSRSQLEQLPTATDPEKKSTRAKKRSARSADADAGESESSDAPAPEETSEPTLAERRRSLEAEVAALSRDLRGQQEILRVNEGHEDSFRQWAQRVSSSVIWRVGDDVSRRIHEHEASRRQHSERRTGAAIPLTERLEQARRRVLLSWWWTVPLTIVAVAALIYYTMQEIGEPDWERAVWIALAIVILAIAFLALANHRFYKAVRRHDYEVARALAQERHNTEHFIWAGKELVRLRALFDGWKDWTSILGEVVHRTWEPPSMEYENLPDDVVQRLPAAVSVARQQQDHVDLPPALLVGAYQYLYRPGWAIQAFGETYEKFSQGLVTQQSSGYLAVDSDTASSLMSPRGKLVEFWRSGTAREWLSHERLEGLKELSYEGKLSLPDRVVERIGPFTDDTAVLETDYFAPTTVSSTTLALDAFGPRARSENLHYIRRTWVWLPQLADRGVEAAHVHDSGARSGVTVGSATGSTALRVDVSARVRPSLLSVFDDSRRAAAQTDNEEPDDAEQLGRGRRAQGTDDQASAGGDFI